MSNLLFVIFLLISATAAFIVGWLLGKQDAEIKAEAARSAEWDARHGL